MKIKLRTLYLFVALISSSCANQTAPTGGPVDEDAPKLLDSNPLNQSTNFKDQSIILTFNEDIQLKAPSQQVIITPRIDKDVSYTARRNEVIVTFEDKLRENTTYNINFREAIQDLTEGNPVKLNFAFSTGPFIDSLRIQGSIFDLLKSQPLEDYAVALQEKIDTAYYFEVPALYFTKTQKDGTFTFNNLKSGEYHLYAFKDINNDLKLQPSREIHGFIPGMISLTKDTSGIKIPMIQNNTDTLKLISSRQSGKYYEANFNKPLISYHIDFKNNSLPVMLTEDYRTLRLFNIQNSNGQPIHLTAQDSIGFRIDTTLSIAYEPTVREPYQFTATTTPITIIKSNPEINFDILLNKPVRQINNDSLFVFIDSLNIIQIDSQNITFDSFKTKLTINLTIDPTIFEANSTSQQPPSLENKKAGPRATPYFRAGKGSIVSVDNDSLPSVQVEIKSITSNQRGTIYSEIDISYSSYIVEFLDTKGTVIERRFNEKSPIFKNLSPGNYMIRILEDPNSDQVFDLGNIYTDTPPDEIHYYTFEGKREIAVRANFEITIPISMK